MMPYNVDQLTPGYELPRLIKNVTMEKMKSFSSWTKNSKYHWVNTNIHMDEDFAKSIGFPKAVTQSLMPYSYLIEMLTRYFGQSWLETGKIDVSFIRQVYRDDTISARAKILELKEEDSRRRIEIEVWCENQNNEKTAVGTASLLV